MDDENSSRTGNGRSAPAGPKYPSLRHKTAFVGADDAIMSSLRVVNVSPREEQPHYFTSIDTVHTDPLDSPISTPAEDTRVLFSPSVEEMSSPIASAAPASVFDALEEPSGGQITETSRQLEDEEYEEDEFELDSFNLKAPLPGRLPNKLEALTDRFFSADHLDTILRDQSLAVRFSGFLDSYLPQYLPTFKQYAEIQKCIKAIEYANATYVSQVSLQYGHSDGPAARLDSHFEAKTKQLIGELVDEALPAYLTHLLVSLVTDTLVKEITGTNIMHSLIPSLAEVYCISDPSLKDNPIVYASEEFYNTTLYGREQVIGRNCRFLQGPKTSKSSVRRLIEALSRGEECCETVLNYKRDGTPFMNLLLISPMYDNKGMVRYFLGCQIDVSSLIEGGKGIESFAQLLSQDCSESRSAKAPIHKDPMQALHDLGKLISLEEADAMNNRPRRTSIQPLHSLASRATTGRPASRGSRIILGMDLSAPETQMWPHASLGPSGRLPGVYQNYLLVRPYPSLRITFTSPALRIPGLLQTKFLDRIGGPESVRTRLSDALTNGTGVTAKIAWLTSGSDSLDHGKVRWIHCTPLMGSDQKVGVWMVVMVENELITGGLNRHSKVVTPGVDSVQGAQRYTGAKLYADYLRREGRPGTGETITSTSSTRERRTVDEVFRDF